MMRPVLLVLLFAAAPLFAAKQAHAQTNYGYRSGAPAGGAAPGIAVAPVAPVRPGTRIYTTGPNPTAVYIAPKNCGVYRYWDGTQCVDARDNPPPLDRERPIR